MFIDFNTGLIIDVLPDREKHFISLYLSAIQHSTLKAHNNNKLNDVTFASIEIHDNYRDLYLIKFSSVKVCADAII